jgi:hypothetical protein
LHARAASASGLSVESNSSRVWVESDPIGPDKERDLQAPGSKLERCWIEQGEGMVQENFSTITKIQRALEPEGITFTANQDDGIGVWLRKKPQRG